MKNKVISIIVLVPLLLLLFSCFKIEVKEDVEERKNEEAVQTNVEVNDVNGIQPINNENIIGIWQDSPVAASGWSSVYLFFENSEYEYNYSQMNKEPIRLLGIRGRYELQDNIIKLYPEKNKMLVGGIVEESLGLGKRIVDGKIEYINDDSLEIKEVDVKGIYISEFGRQIKIVRKTINIEDIEYYLLDDNPKEY